jgi:hypothetical protein
MGVQEKNPHVAMKFPAFSQFFAKFQRDHSPRFFILFGYGGLKVLIYSFSNSFELSKDPCRDIESYTAVHEASLRTSLPHIRTGSKSIGQDL